MSEEIRLSDLVDREIAEEIAKKNMPESFKWEVNRKSDLTSVPEWIIKSIIEYSNEK